jgi:transposase
MRQEHRAGKKLFGDYAGQNTSSTDRPSKSARPRCSSLSWASRYTFAEATWSQKLPDWLGSH